MSQRNWRGRLTSIGWSGKAFLHCIWSAEKEPLKLLWCEECSGEEPVQRPRPGGMVVRGGEGGWVVRPQKMELEKQ